MTNACEVADYLKNHPEFFAERGDLLAAMNLPEPPAAAPVHERLHERRAQALRERQDMQQARLDLVMNTVKSNQDLELGLHRLAVSLLSLEGIDRNDPRAPAGLVSACFDIDNAAVFLSSQQQDLDRSIDYPLLCRRVEHLGSVCDDRVSSKLNAALFPDAGTVASCAFVPLAHRQKLCGVMVLGSDDKQRFQPGMGVLILDRLGQLIGAHMAGRNLV